MIIRSKKILKESATTPESVYLRRRDILKQMALAGLAIAAPRAGAGLFTPFSQENSPQLVLKEREKLAYKSAGSVSGLALTPEQKVLGYNNFYEFGTDKSDPVKNSQHLKTEPWTIEVTGEVAKPGVLDIAALLQSPALEERVYRMRCVEAWSMVIPWVGIELGKVLKGFEPTSRAKFVAFQTLYDPEQMPGQESRWVGGGIDYPYVEGLRIDEAMHPLTLLSVGLYGKTLAPQNGAPVRLVVPWKYGFKGIKSIVRMTLVEKMPPTSWNLLAPNEYGFYANVNPAVDHPRWSQKRERFIGEGGLLSVNRQDTLPFNGYGDEVAGLYTGLNLRRWY